MPKATKLYSGFGIRLQKLWSLLGIYFKASFFKKKFPMKNDALGDARGQGGKKSCLPLFKGVFETYVFIHKLTQKWSLCLE